MRWAASPSGGCRGVGGRIAFGYAQRMTQFVTRLDGSLAAEVDRLVTTGLVASRSEAVRLGLRHLVDHYRRERTGSAIVDGYRRLPQTAEDVAWADDATRRMIAEEPW